MKPPRKVENKLHRLLLPFRDLDVEFDIEALNKLTTFLENTEIENLDFNQFREVEWDEDAKYAMVPFLWMLIMLWESGYHRPLAIVLTKISDMKLNALDFNAVPVPMGKLNLCPRFKNVFSYFVNTLFYSSHKHVAVLFDLPFRIAPEKLHILDPGGVEKLLLMVFEKNSKPFLIHLIRHLLDAQFDFLITFSKDNYPFVFMYLAYSRWEMADIILQRLSFIQLCNIENGFLNLNKKSKLKPPEEKLLLYIQTYKKVKQIQQLLQEEEEEKVNLAITNFKNFGEENRPLISHIFHPLAFLYKETKDFSHLAEIVDKLEKGSSFYLEVCYELAHYTLCEAITAGDDSIRMLTAFEYARVANNVYPEDALLANIGYYYLHGIDAPPPSQEELTLLSQALKPGAEKDCLFLLRAKKKEASLEGEKTEIFTQKRIGSPSSS